MAIVAAAVAVGGVAGGAVILVSLSAVLCDGRTIKKGVKGGGLVGSWS